MGNGIVIGHIGTGHAAFPPTPVTAGSGTVKYDGIPAARKGDPLAAHAQPNYAPHARAISGGSATVMVDGKPAARAGDPIGCGGSLQGGSSVNIG